MILVLGGIKGGSGKTTIATNLTVIRASSGKKVLLVDADDQKSTSIWSEQRESGEPYENFVQLDQLKTSWTTIQLSGLAVRSQIQKMANDYDDVIIDVGGRETSSLRAALTIADIFVIPFQPRSLDIWTIGPVKTLINEVTAMNPKLISYGLINRADSFGKDNEDAMEILKEHLSCIPVMIGQRKAFANAASEGLGVIEMKNRDKKAIDEMNSLYSFLYQNDIKKTSK